MNSDQRKKALEELKTYAEEKLITEEEFVKAKADLLQGLVGKETPAPDLIDSAWFSLSNFPECNSGHLFFPFEGVQKAFVVYCDTLKIFALSRIALKYLQYKVANDPLVNHKPRAEDLKLLQRRKLSHNTNIKKYLGLDGKTEVFGLDTLNYLYNQGRFMDDKKLERCGLQCSLIEGVSVWKPVRPPVTVVEMPSTKRKQSSGTQEDDEHPAKRAKLEVETESTPEAVEATAAESVALEAEQLQ